MKKLLKLLLVFGLVRYLVFITTPFEMNIEALNTPIELPKSIEVNRGVNANRDLRTNADRIYYYLTDNGIPHIQTCAIMGNLYQESRLDENCIESNGIGFGLVQWSFERRTQLFEELEDPYDLYQQLDFLIKELDVQWTRGYKDIFDNTDNIEEATIAFCNGFERAGIPMMDTRIRQAIYYSEFYK